MKLQIRESIESDGKWLKVYRDNICKACFKLDTEIRTNAEAMKRAEEVFQYMLENGDSERIIKEYETKVSE